MPPTPGHEVRRSLFEFLTGHKPDDTEGAYLDAFPDTRSLPSDTMTESLPLVVAGCIWMSLGPGPAGPLYPVKLLYPGKHKAAVVDAFKGLARQAVRRYLAMGRKDRVDALCKALALIVPTHQREPVEPERWVAVGFLPTDPVPTWMSDTFWSPDA